MFNQEIAGVKRKSSESTKIRFFFVNNMDIF